MKNQTVIICILVSLLLGSIACSDKYESLKDLNQSPKITLSRTLLMVRVGDTLTQSGLIKVICSDAENNSIHFKAVDTSNGKVIILYDKKKLPDNTIPNIKDTTRIYVIPMVPGLYTIKFIVEDRFGKKDSINLDVQTIPNQIPFASFSILQTNGREYKIDAAASTDPDGVIVKYHYDIDGISISTSLKSINHIFNSPGIKTIKVAAEDDAGGISIQSTQLITVL